VERRAFIRAVTGGLVGEPFAALVQQAGSQDREFNATVE